MADQRIILDFVGSSQMKTVIKDLETVRGLTKEETKELNKLNAQAKELESSFIRGSEGAKRLDKELKKQPKTLAEMELKLSRLKELLRDDTKLGTEGFRRVKKEVENTQKAIDKANKSLTETKSKGNKLISTFKSVGAALGIAFGVQQITQFGKEAIQLAATGQGIRRAFAKLNQPGLLNDLKEATRGTVTELNLMKSAVRADNFRIPLEQLATYFEFATKRSIETGESVEYLTQSIVDGIGRKSTLVLDNLGISASELQEEIKKTGDFGQAAANIISRSLEETGEVADTLSTQIARLSTEWDNFKESSGQALGEVLVRLADSIGLIKENQGAIDQFTKSIEGLGRAALLEKEKEIRKELVSIRNRSLQLQKQDAVLAKEAVLLKGEELEENRRIRDEIFRQRNELTQKTKNANDFIIVLKEEAKLRKEISEESSGQEEFYNPDQLMRILGPTEELNDAQKKSTITINKLQEEIKVLRDKLNDTDISSEELSATWTELQSKTEQLNQVMMMLGGAQSGSISMLNFEIKKLQDELNKVVPASEDFWKILTRLNAKMKELQQATSLLNLEEALKVDAEVIPDISGAVIEYPKEVERATDIADRLWEAHFNNLIAKQDEEFANTKRIEQERKALLTETITAASSIASSIAQIQQNRIRADLQDLQRRYEAGQITREEFENEQRQLQRRSAQAAKDAALFNAVISTSQAVINALSSPGVPFPVAAGFAALAAAQGAVQIAAIASEPLPQFAEGGWVDDKGKIHGRSHSHGGVRIEAEGDEFITKGAEAKKWPEALESINAGKFDEYLQTELALRSISIPLRFKDGIKVQKRSNFDYDKLAKAISNELMFSDSRMVNEISRSTKVNAEGLHEVIRTLKTKRNTRTGW